VSSSATRKTTPRKRACDLHAAPGTAGSSASTASPTAPWLAREAFEALGDEPQPLDDLLGLELFLADGTRIGEVSSFYDLPQGPMLEITRAEDTVLFPLHEDFIVEMDVPGRRLVVAPPPGLFD
jgi:ribosomal 30S subunit maturation factor RimM